MIRWIMFEAFAETDDVIVAIPDLLIKRDHQRVGFAHLQIDFRAAERAQGVFGGGHHLRGNAVPLAFRLDRQIIDPPAMPFISGHAGGDDAAVALTDEKQFRIHPHFARNIMKRVVGGRD